MHKTITTHGIVYAVGGGGVTYKLTMIKYYLQWDVTYWYLLIPSGPVSDTSICILCVTTKEEFSILWLFGYS